jgi:hypothetical protein
VVAVVGPEESGSGYAWWSVRAAMTGEFGYVRSDFLDVLT